MHLEKLLGSKAKVDIIKYLLFKRQGVSMRALENDLTWTFPAIKKQIDALQEAQVIAIVKDKTKWSITLKQTFSSYLKKICIHYLVFDIQIILQDYVDCIKHVYYGKVFGSQLDMDLVLVHSFLPDQKEQEILHEIKTKISLLFADYFLDTVSMTTMSEKEWMHRYRLADKFVLTILRDKIEIYEHSLLGGLQKN